jgi:aryl-alcohol dehydrogenase-like predicted oxidoreductase
MTFSDGTDFWKHVGTVDQAGADMMIKASVEASVNFINAADVYAFGQETTLGQSLKKLHVKLDVRDKRVGPPPSRSATAN